jgi:hypothetical protein
MRALGELRSLRKSTPRSLRKSTPRSLRKLDYPNLKEADYQKLNEADYPKRNPLNMEVGRTRLTQKEPIMSLALFINDSCPNCHKPTMQAVIEPHPTRRDLALENFACADCGPVKTKVLSLKPGTPSPELAA